MASFCLAASPLLSLRLTTSATHRRSFPSPAVSLGTNATPRMNAARLRLQLDLGSFRQPPQRKKCRCEAESVDTDEPVAKEEEKVTEEKKALTEKQGPPVLTILAGIVIAVLVIGGLWSLISALVGLFFH